MKTQFPKAKIFQETGAYSLKFSPSSDIMWDTLSSSK